MSLDSISAALCQRVLASPRVALYLDFDGTLAPIVQHYEDASLPSHVREVLTRLADDPRFVIAIVSGRSITDLRSKVGIPGLIYAGNHGLEIEGAGLSFQAPEAVAARNRLAAVAATIQESLRSVPGAEVENKGFTVSVHFRSVDPAQHAKVAEILAEQVPPGDSQLVLRDAKMVIEIRPRVRWNKGEGVLWIRRKLELQPALEVYIGDDATDEDAFELLPDAFTIHVGAGSTAARYRLANTGEVALLLSSVFDKKETYSDAG